MSIQLNNFRNAEAAFSGVPTILRPSVRGQNRLEGRPRADEFDRSLRAEVRDPLWFLTRQWQFGEFVGEDAGSPIDARVQLERTQLTRYAPNGQPVGPFPEDLPLEAVVERETVPHDLVTIRQVVAATRRALDSAGASNSAKAQVLELYRTSFTLQEKDIDGVLDAESARMLLLALGQLFNVKQFLAAIDAGHHDSLVDSASGLSNAAKTAAKAAARSVREFYTSLYSEPDADQPSAWDASHLEYRFDCETVSGRNGTRLAATDYRGGHLDWSEFDIVRHRDGNEQPDVKTDVLSFIPAAVTFAGMPNPRFWEMEDRRIEFSDITSKTTDTAKLLLTEFALAWANDWVMIPVELEVGSLCSVNSLVVRDVFGESHLIRAAGGGVDDDWERFSLFGLSTFRNAADNRVFLPPATPTLIQPPPIEKVVFLRDEMANMAWAVESIVPSAGGIGIDGERPATENLPADALQAPAPGAEVRYQLGNEPPTHWFPFIPVHTPGQKRSVRMQRARLPDSDRAIQGQIINEATPYFIEEEEMPRSGRIVTRSFQRCRWMDGRIVQWLGRRVKTGRGEGASGLEFDSVDPF